MDAKQFLIHKGISNNDFMDSGVADLIETLLREYQALQLLQTGVIKSVCDCAKDEFCCRCHESKGWKIENGKYVKQTDL